VAPARTPAAASPRRLVAPVFRRAEDGPGDRRRAWEGSELLPGDDAIGAIRQLREREGGGLYVLGSASVSQALIEHDLVDEYVLMIEPILLGGGKTIFPSGRSRRPLELVSAEPADTGVIMATYRRAA